MGRDKIRLGIYSHYKGDHYEVVGIAKHSETLEKMVIYRLCGEQTLWVRTLKMFLEKIEVNGKKISRFYYMGDGEV